MGKCYKSKVINLAKKQVGTTEKPINKVKYNKWYYGKDISGDAYPWCMSFQSWLFNECDGLNLIGGKSASCSQTIEWFKKNKKWYSTPKVGDLVFFTFSHTELVIEVHNGYIITIGGNTSPDTSVDKSIKAQRNGGGVYIKKRLLNSTIKGFGRPEYDSKYEKVKVTTKGKLCKEMNVTKTVYKIVQQNDTVDFVKDMKNGWSKVKNGGYIGYMKNTCFRPKMLSNYPIKELTIDAPLRIKNKKGSKVLVRLPKGTKVKLVSKALYWSNVKVTYKNKNYDGFISSKKIK